jgi:hypothetical protein
MKLSIQRLSNSELLFHAAPNYKKKMEVKGVGIPYKKSRAVQSRKDF